MRTTWTNDIREAATAVGLESDLVEAVVISESSGNPWAIRYERHYGYLVDVRTRKPFRPLTELEQRSERAPADFVSLAGNADQEWISQQASFGLMQLMGALARELGFRGPFLTELCRVDVNLRLGCLHLSNLMRWAHGDVQKAVGAFNAGYGNTWDSAAGRAYRLKVFSKRAELAPRKPSPFNT